MAINKVFLCGNLTRDPEKRKAGETPVIGFGIAVNEYRKNGEYTHFFDVDVFGKRAVALADSLKKGMRVVIEGRLRYSTWETEGQKRSKVSIVADDVQFMNAKSGEAAADTEEIPW